MTKPVRKLIAICLLLMAIPVGITARSANRYSTELLSELATKACLKLMTDTLSEGVHRNVCQLHGNGITAIVRNGQVEHIGYTVFSLEQRMALPSPIYNFLERYALQMDLPREETFSVSKRMEMDKVSFTAGSLKMLPTLSKDSLIAVSFSNHSERAYTVEWKKNGKVICKVFFPASYELLHGSLMIENEKTLHHDICNFVSLPRKEVLLGKEWATKSDSMTYVVKKGHNRIAAMANNIYYTPSQFADSLKILFTPRKPVESFANLFCSRQIANDITANVTLRKYNFQSEQFSVPLNQLVDFFYSEKCVPYFGLLKYQEKEGKMIAVVQMRNTEQAYEHLMKVTIDVSTIAKRSGVVSVILTGYIATQKIKNLYADGK